MEFRGTERALLGLAVALLLLACLSGTWELLAGQQPYSPLHVGLLPEPVAQLRRTAFNLAVLFLATTWLLPALSPGRPRRKLIASVYLGSLLVLGSMAYGAARGMMGVQLWDAMRPDAQILAATRVLGFAALFGALLSLLPSLVRLVRSRSDSTARGASDAEAANDRGDAV